MIFSVTATDCKRFESCFNFKLPTEYAVVETGLLFSQWSQLYCEQSMEGQKMVES